MRIRIRIQIQSFQLFMEKFTAEIKFIFFLIIKDVQAIGEVIIPQKKTASTSKFKFSSLCGLFWPTWFRIRIPNADPDPDRIQPTKMNVDPCGSATMRNNRQLSEARLMLIRSNTLASKMVKILFDTQIEEKRKNQCSGSGSFNF
jgi:hypothetical protein